ncbi:putative glycoside hydrolase [Sulfurimonas sp.]|uniref:putative glycoside hydrolase n=1 Tax=Sulfurimonas sp. TaxID=2022749 RepID=UPI0025E1A268|nr:putative glycoside hydrolase [Sulfurimonas sp.]MBW6487586.1 GTP-binding protein [Sulfurimonas sp.]
MKILLFAAVLLQNLLFASFSANIIDATTSKPIKDATVSNSNFSVKSDAEGFFSIDNGEKILHVKACGYRPYKIESQDEDATIKLEPLIVKALYLSFWHTSNQSPKLRDMLKIIDETEVNTVVVDVKNEYGQTSFKTSFEQGNSYGAHKSIINRNITEFMKLMKSKNIYTVARVVTFKDELQAINNQDYAIKREDGTIWRNHDNMAWVDPFDKRAHNYTISIAEEAAKVGFNEINFDYIRFPAKDGLKYSKESTQENRIKAISDFLALAQKRLRKYGVFISADTYGNICWTDDDNNIGQTISSMAQHADYLAPMLYPSGFASGSFSLKHPSDYPHEVIYKSIKNIEDRIETKRVRPWLQYFKDYAHTRRDYKKFEIREQIRAVEDINTSGWMMWSPSSRYHMDYFVKIDE